MRVTNLPKPHMIPTFPISLLSTADKFFEEAVLRIVHRHIQEGELLNPGQFVFRVRHNTTLQCTKPMNHVTLNYKNTVPTAAVNLNIEKDFGTNDALVCCTSYIN
jgi:hypothetical protein